MTNIVSRTSYWFYRVEIPPDANHVTAPHFVVRLEVQNSDPPTHAGVGEYDRNRPARFVDDAGNDITQLMTVKLMTSMAVSFDTDISHIHYTDTPGVAVFDARHTKDVTEETARTFPRYIQNYQWVNGDPVAWSGERYNAPPLYDIAYDDYQFVTPPPTGGQVALVTEQTTRRQQATVRSARNGTGWSRR